MDWKTRLPGLSGNTDMDMKRVLDYSFQLSEEIRYYLNNLDMSNFNQVEWATYENGLLQIVAEGVTVLISDAEKRLSVKWEADIEGFKSTVESYEETVDAYTKEVTGYKQQVSSYQQTVSGFNTTVRSYEQTLSGYKDQVSTFEQTANKIALMVSSVDDANGNVTAASIVAAINAAGSSVKIAADHVNISGFVTFTDLNTAGRTAINAGNITTGYISADRISGGTISGVTLESQAGTQSVTIANGNITFPNGSITNARGYGFTVESTTDMFIGSSEDVYVTADGYIYLMVGTQGKCWRIGSDGIYFCNNSYREPTHWVPTQSL